MTRKTRYFLIGSVVLLLVGIGVGLVAYYGTRRSAGIPVGLPGELRYVPASAELVAYADVQVVMNSDLRRELERATLGPRRGRSDIHEFAGIDLEKQVHHIVAYLEKMDIVSTDSQSAQPAEPRRDAPPRGLMLVRGTFEQSKVEQFIGEHGGAIEDYHGKHIAVHRPAADGQERQGRADQTAIGFLQPGLVALGHVDLVRQAIDLSTNTSTLANITSNADLMNLIRDAAGDTAWVVGHFDAVSRRMGVPSTLRQQVPPLRLVVAKARINGGVKATIKAETADQAAADQFRDVIRGFVSLIRLQAGAKPDLQDALKSVELGGSGNTVQLSFAMTPETFRAIVPQRGQRRDAPPALPRPPLAPPPPAR
jgi:hypothetical protein